MSYRDIQSSNGRRASVPPAKLGEVTALRIEKHIAEQGWPNGEVIGSESELLDEYGVSRAVLREAIRLLEHHGVATMRRGPGGGLVAKHPLPSSAVRPAQLYLEFAGVGPRQLIEARIALETVAVRAATEALTEDGVVRLRQCVEAEGQIGEEFDMAIHDLHVVIAQLSLNPALQLFVEVLTRLTHQGDALGELFIPGSTARQPRLVLDEVHRSHVAIAEAIIAGDSALASRRMIKHLSATATYLEKMDEGLR